MEIQFHVLRPSKMAYKHLEPSWIPTIIVIQSLRLCFGYLPADSHLLYVWKYTKVYREQYIFSE